MIDVVDFSWRSVAIWKG